MVVEKNKERFANFCYCSVCDQDVLPSKPSFSPRRMRVALGALENTLQPLHNRCDRVKGRIFSCIPVRPFIRFSLSLKTYRGRHLSLFALPEHLSCSTFENLKMPSEEVVPAGTSPLDYVIMGVKVCSMQTKAQTRTHTHQNGQMVESLRFYRTIASPVRCTVMQFLCLLVFTYA
jgi:hypothetical protein